MTALGELGHPPRVPSANQTDIESHRLTRTWKDRLLRAIPFGLSHIKPRHFRNMASVAFENRDNVGYAWKVLSKGVCDGCALGVSGFHDWTLDGIHLCMTRLNLLRLNTMGPLDETRLSDARSLVALRNDELRALGRLPFPMLRERSAKGFRRIAWSEALSRIGARLRATDPRRMAFFLTSRGVTNEVYYVAQKVARFLKTNNVDNAARLCHAPSTAAMKKALGVAASTCGYRDWIGTDLIVFFGSNPANDQPVATKYLHEAKKKGTRVVLVNPYREPGMERYWVPSVTTSAIFGTDLADHWYPVAQGGDLAFLYGVLKVLFAEDWLDAGFVSRCTTGLAALQETAQALSWEALEASAGLSRSSMREFAALIHRARNGVLVWSMGITQHEHGADTVAMILNLGLLQGWVGRDKTGLVPIRGHSSVQGGAEMGAYSTAFPGGKPIDSENAAWLGNLYGFEVPDWPGLQTTAMVEAAFRGELDFFYNVGGNLLRNLPDPAHVEASLARVPLRIHQDILLNDQMLVEGAGEVILLPAKTRYEQDDGGTETSTERRVMFSPELPRQVGEARAEWRILLDVARAARPEHARLLGCETGWAIRDEIAKVVPFYAGIEALKKAGDSFQYGGPRLCEGGNFPTPDGKAHFAAVPLPAHARGTGLFHVSTRRGKQFNSMIYAATDPLNGAPRDAILMSEADAQDIGLANGERVALVNERGRFEGRVFLSPIAKGNLQVHFPEGNMLIRRGVVDTRGGVPDYNALVRVEKARPGGS